MNEGLARFLVTLALLGTLAFAAVCFFWWRNDSLPDKVKWSGVAGIWVALALAAFVFQDSLRDAMIADREIPNASYICTKHAGVDLGRDDNCTKKRQAVLDSLPSDLQAECRQAHSKVATQLLSTKQFASDRVGQCKVSGAVDRCEPNTSVCTLPINRGRSVSVIFWRAW